MDEILVISLFKCLFSYGKGKPSREHAQLQPFSACPFMGKIESKEFNKNSKVRKDHKKSYFSFFILAFRAKIVVG